MQAVIAIVPRTIPKSLLLAVVAVVAAAVVVAVVLGILTVAAVLEESIEPFLPDSIHRARSQNLIYFPQGLRETSRPCMGC
jgi:hypothetical protein